MNNKTANIENFGNRIRKLALFLPLCTYFYVIVEYTYPTRGETQHPRKLTRVSGIYPQTDPPKQRHGWHPKPNQPRVFFTGAEPCSLGFWVTPNNGASTNPFSALLGSGKMCSDTPPFARLQRMNHPWFPTKLGI